MKKNPHSGTLKNDSLHDNCWLTRQCGLNVLSCLNLSCLDIILLSHLLLIQKHRKAFINVERENSHSQLMVYIFKVNFPLGFRKKLGYQKFKTILRLSAEDEFYIFLCNSQCVVQQHFLNGKVGTLSKLVSTEHKLSYKCKPFHKGVFSQ